MDIGLLDLKEEFKIIKDDVKKQLDSCFQSQQWILGQKVAEFEQICAKYIGSKYAVGVASGTDALLLSLRVLLP